MTDPRPAILSVKNENNKPQSTCVGFFQSYMAKSHVPESKTMFKQILVTKQFHVLNTKTIYSKRQGYRHFSVEHLRYRKY